MRSGWSSKWSNATFFPKKKPFVTLVTLKFKYQIFKIGSNYIICLEPVSNHASNMMQDLATLIIEVVVFLEDEFHLHQGHFCHFNDYLRMRYETTSECLLDHPNRASMVFFVAGGEKSGKRCSMLKFGWPPPLSNHKTWSKLPWSPFFAISLTNAIPPTRWKVLQHAIPHHWCDEPTIHGPKFTITEASHRSACLVVVNPQWAERMRAIYLGGSSQDLDTCLLPGKRTNVPWKSMVGRCSSYGTSPFLGDMIVLV